MAKLTAAERAALPDSAFALPGRRFPIPDEEHGSAALRDMMIGGAATRAERAGIRRAVYRRFPAIAERLE